MGHRICMLPDCNNPHRARGLCSGHWKRKYGKPRVYRQVPCAACGEPAQQTGSGRRAVCSVACRTLLQWPKRSSPVWFRHCELCGRLFSSQAADAKWCSDRCRADGTRTSWPSCKVFLRDCTVCGVLFATPYTVVTCSKQCASVKRRDDHREAKHKRRARKRDAFVARVTRRSIFERDRWRCHICGKPVRRKAVVPHPLAPTLDHLIPLAEGGTHEPANVRTAHYRCNVAKGDRGGGEQLMLIG